MPKIYIKSKDVADANVVEKDGICYTRTGSVVKASSVTLTDILSVTKYYTDCPGCLEGEVDLSIGSTATVANTASNFQFKFAGSSEGDTATLELSGATTCSVLLSVNNDNNLVFDAGTTPTGSGPHVFTTVPQTIVYTDCNLYTYDVTLAGLGSYVVTLTNTGSAGSLPASGGGGSQPLSATHLTYVCAKSDGSGSSYLYVNAPSGNHGNSITLSGDCYGMIDWTAGFQPHRETYTGTIYTGLSCVSTPTNYTYTWDFSGGNGEYLVTSTNHQDVGWSFLWDGTNPASGGGSRSLCVKTGDSFNFTNSTPNHPIVFVSNVTMDSSDINNAISQGGDDEVLVVYPGTYTFGTGTLSAFGQGTHLYKCQTHGSTGMAGYIHISDDLSYCI